MRKTVSFLILVLIFSLACGLTRQSDEPTPAPTSLPTFMPGTVPTPLLTLTTAPTTIPTTSSNTGSQPQQQPTAVPPPTVVTGPGGCTNESRFVTDVTIPDGTVVQPGVPFTKTWRIRNSGTCAWEGNYTFVQITTEYLVAQQTSISVPRTLPGAEVDLSMTLTLPASIAAGTEVQEFFQLRTPGGQLFGQTPFVKVIMSSTAQNSGGCVNDSRFISDVTIPDGTIVEPGIPFAKIWRLRNTGTCTWDGSYQFVKISGDFITANPSAVSVPLTPPGAEVNISMTLVLSPETALGSEVSARFRMRNGSGEFFGQRPFVTVVAGTP